MRPIFRVKPWFLCALAAWGELGGSQQGVGLVGGLDRGLPCGAVFRRGAFRGTITPLSSPGAWSRKEGSLGLLQWKDCGLWSHVDLLSSLSHATSAVI